MGRKFSRFFIRGWNVVEAPEMTKALVIMAPHTSMIDFIHGKLYFSSCGYKPKFLMKAEMFKWPLSPILRALGAVPILKCGTVHFRSGFYGRLHLDGVKGTTMRHRSRQDRGL